MMESGLNELSYYLDGEETLVPSTLALQFGASRHTNELVDAPPESQNIYPSTSYWPTEWSPPVLPEKLTF